VTRHCLRNDAKYDHRNFMVDLPGLSSVCKPGRNVTDLTPRSTRNLGRNRGGVAVDNTRYRVILIYSFTFTSLSEYK